VVKAVTKNRGSGKEIMTLLLNQRGSNVLITEGVVKAVAGNWGSHRSGKEMMTLLLNRRGGNTLITEGVVKAMVGN